VGFVIGSLNVLLVLASVFLVCLVLIQRGKGGGLAGAFGGPGGSSAFGAKAGDIFTRITIITAGVWIALAMLQVILINNQGETGSAFKSGNRTTSEPAPESSKGLEDLLREVERGNNGAAPPIEAPKGADAASGNNEKSDAVDALPSALTPPPDTGTKPATDSGTKK
jgi:preprotein translocase subunit SecG